jgi:GntR family transcriptional regulator/MocR family aminotransferase
MDRPDYQILKEIHLERKAGIPLFQQLVDSIAKNIQLGILKNGERLPSSRVLSKTLGLNRNTVLKALEELESLGWIKVYPKKGCIIHFEDALRKSISTQTPQFPPSCKILIEQSNLVSWPTEQLPFPYLIQEGKRDENLVDGRIGAKIYAQSLEENPRYLGEREMSEYFQKRFINYLKVHRNISLKPQEFLVCRSPEICLQLISRVLLKPQEKIGVSDLGHFKNNMLFQSHGIALELLPSDEEGVRVEGLKKKVSPLLKGVFLESLHQFPTAVRMSETRKWEMMEWAEKNKLFIVDSQREEDYYYISRPELGFKKYISHGQVLILGEIGAELGEGFKIGYLLGPADAIAELKKYQPLYADLQDPTLLRALAKSMEDGSLGSLVKKHRRIYKERRETMGNLFLQYFGSEIQLQLPKVGLGMWIKFKTPLNLMELKRQSEKKGLGIPLSCIYQSKNHHDLRIGFAELEERKMEKIVRILFDSYREVRSSEIIKAV